MFGLLRLFTRRKEVSSEVSSSNLSRCLTTWDLVSLSIGATLGAGIYVVTGQVAGSIAGPAVIVSFTIAAVASVLSGLCYAEFGARVPHTTGSAYTYSYVTVGEFAAFVIGWNLILEYMIGTAADARALSGCFDYVIGHAIRNFTLSHIGTFHIPTIGDTYLDFLSCILTLAVTGVLASGVKQSSVFSTVCNVVNLAVVGFIIIAGAFYVKRENWSVKSGFFPYGVSGVLGGAATCFYAFVGFDIIATTGQETRNPQHSIPLAIMISLFIVFMCYFSVSSIITLMLPYYKLDKLSPIPNAFAQRGLHTATYIVGVGAVCGLSSSLMGSLFPLPRIIYAMANDGLLFESFRKISSRSDIPFVATIYPGILTSILALVFNLDELVEMMSIGTLLAYTLVSLCVLILRYQPNTHLSPGDSLSSGSFDFGELALNDNVDFEKRSSKTTEKLETNGVERRSKNIVNPRKSEVASINGIDKDFVENVYHKNEKSTFMDGSSNLSSLVMDSVSMSKKNGKSLYTDDQVSAERTVLSESDYQNESVYFSFPTEKTGRIVCWASLLLCISSSAFFALIVHAIDFILHKNIVVIALTLIVGFLSIICIGVIAAMPQNTTRLSFNVPCVPGIPILAIFFNTFLMIKLSRVTWLRFIVWMILGLAIYFLYGLRHSFVGLQLKMRAHMELEQRPCVLSKNLCQFDYDMDVIPAHREQDGGKSSPISPIFWSSLQKYHFFASDYDEKDANHEMH
ncbi:high affinity cationic amino acid transporter 1-like [Dendronephthya gigantea]|uniref:high affinity cationic amino acid transporter 1-like n=1 Tax=Dendronephthya gigantea TaxID=151771 RepID=UPI00106A5CDB|nr:high affinity cationic amino acid transporter 1-like [Dendronephthya gigantea]